MRRRTNVYIDGFNLYHSIDDVSPLNKYKWLDVRRLVSLFLKIYEILNKIYYFTAFAYWDTRKVKKHRTIISVFKDMGIIPVFGAFRKKWPRCPFGYKCMKREEKRTDVNIAVELLNMACKNQFDTAYILSGDSDLTPAAAKVKREFAQKVVKVIIPYGRRAEELAGSADARLKIKRKHIISSRLPDPYILESGIEL